MEDNSYAVYILMNKMRTVNYTGVTNDLIRRSWEHKNKVNDGFTKRYKVDKLVYYEFFEDINNAIAREKQLKGWSKAKKMKLIESLNPYYKDLWEDLCK
ncbi:MAG: GIY-YIG nuclease family protein [Candidatus Parcubacteria bacterium]|nr:GIY-YIG nuclease family protein [Candidatus Parcubacteria bacterium]